MIRIREQLFYLFLWVLFLSINCKAQFPEFKFEHINENQNLSHSSVLDIIQDNEGFLWFGTIDGLNRFDGYSCKVFKHSDKDSGSISSSFIHGLYIDTNGTLWITTRDGGLNKFNKFTETFTSYRYNPDNPRSISSDKVSGIIQDENGNYWVTTEEGLDSFDPVTGEFKHLNFNDYSKELADIKSLDKMYKDKAGFIWICSLYGLLKFNPIKKAFELFKNIKNNSNSLNDNFIHFLFEDDNYLWITTNGGGLTRYDKLARQFKVFNPPPDKSTNNTKSNLGEIVPYNKNIFLIGSEGRGLFFFDKTTNTFGSIKSNPENSHSLSNNHISTIFRDAQNNFWIGTWGGGVNKVITSFSKFTRYSNNPFNKNSISGTSVFALLKDNSGNVWVGTSNGLDKLKANSDKFIHLNLNRGKNEILGKNTYASIFQDISGNIWFASDELIMLNPASNKIQYFTFDPLNPNSISSNNIKCIVGDKEGNVWLGLENGLGGICCYNLKTKKWKRYLSNPENPLLVRYIYKDSLGILWLATTGSGLIKFNPKTGEKKFYINNPGDSNSISYNDVRHIIQTKDGYLWAATYGGGIDRFDPNTEKFLPVKEENGLSNNFTYAILEDKGNNFWISTNYGITKYNRKDNSFKIYTIEDGLQNNEFNTGAFYKAEDGEIFFGGVNGFNRFYPDKVTDNKNIPPVYITSFKLLDKELKTDTSIIFNKNLTISYFDKFFSVEFVALDYTDPSKNQYKYKLDGFDNDWIVADHRRYASYTNLNPGNYILRVKGSNNDGTWNNNGAELNITVSPPFWLEWWFITSVAVAMLIILIVTVRYYSTKKLKEQIYLLEKEKAVQVERERISRDLHDNVGSQLTNIITGIGLAEIYNKSEKQKADDMLSSLKRELRETMTQLRETIWALKSNEMGFDNFTAELKKLIERHQKFFSGSIHLDIKEIEHKNAILKPLQALYIFRIVQEAITNSVKYAEANNIKVYVNFGSNQLSLSIEDDGKGIEEKDTDFINGNGIENMKKRAEEIGGSFELINKAGCGVTINISLPV